MVILTRGQGLDDLSVLGLDGDIAASVRPHVHPDPLEVGVSAHADRLLYALGIPLEAHEGDVLQPEGPVVSGLHLLCVIDNFLCY